MATQAVLHSVSGEVTQNVPDLHAAPQPVQSENVPSGFSHPFAGSPSQSAKPAAQVGLHTRASPLPGTQRVAVACAPPHGLQSAAPHPKAGSPRSTHALKVAQ